MHGSITRFVPDRTALLAQLPHRFAWAWNRHDMEAAFADFDDDAEFIDAERGRLRGYGEIVGTFEALHESGRAAADLAIDDVRLRLVSLDSAYVAADWTLCADALEPRHGTLLFVAARHGSSWRVFAAQNTARRRLAAT